MTSWLDQSAQKSEWSDVGSASDILVTNLSDLYWEGVTREVSDAILSYKLLESVPPLPEEEDIFQRLPSGVFEFIEAWGEHPVTNFRNAG
jgi:hypothetical protein